MSEAIYRFLAERRSAKPAMLEEPGPDGRQLEAILSVAARVPDHKKLAPWRFIIFEGEARSAFGARLAAAVTSEQDANASDLRLEAERTRLTRAPTVVAVVSSPVETPGVPQLEQVLSCGAACLNLCLAANALGFQTSWITEWYSYSPMIAKALNLGEQESIAGFIYIGTASERQPDRERPELDAIVTRWQPES